MVSICKPLAGAAKGSKIQAPERLCTFRDLFLGPLHLLHMMRLIHWNRECSLQVMRMIAWVQFLFQLLDLLCNSYEQNYIPTNVLLANQAIHSFMVGKLVPEIIGGNTSYTVTGVLNIGCCQWHQYTLISSRPFTFIHHRTLWKCPWCGLGKVINDNNDWVL